MLMKVHFDCDADIIDVPQDVVQNCDLYRKRFLKWLYNKSIKHKYWVRQFDGQGNEFWGVRYRSDAFVEWLNKKELDKGNEKAVVIKQYVSFDSGDFPTVYF